MLLEVAQLIDVDVLFFPALLLLSLLLGKRSLLFVVVSMLLVLSLKPLISEERPCAGLPGCPESYAFPSGHALVVAALAFSRYGEKDFLPLFAFALFVGYTRILLGVHTWQQVFAGFALAVFLLELRRFRWS